MAFCRPFFKNVIFHWHAVGLGDWLQERARPWERWLSKRLLHRPELSIVLGEFNRQDAKQIESQRIAVVPNGIPDPCPDFNARVLPYRLARVEARQRAAGEQQHTFKVLFISLCFSEKGLFDAVEAIAVVNQKLQATNFRVTLTVAGTFFRESEKKEFEHRIHQPDLLTGEQCAVEYQGFVSGKAKKELMLEHDCLCFPTWYSAESFGLVLAEGMAYGMSLIATKWRTIPEILPEGYEGLVEPRSPEQIAEKMQLFLTKDYDPRLRARFLEHYTDDRFAAKILAALKGF
jgi:glycosyltransferase involved in cell wall biosynthesis